MIDKKLFAMVVLGLTNGSEKLLEILDKEDDVQATFGDCDPDEIYVMLEAANAVKRSIRVRKLSDMSTASASCACVRFKRRRSSRILAPNLL